jgi:hypothetical protein
VTRCLRLAQHSSPADASALRPPHYRARELTLHSNDMSPTTMPSREQGREAACSLRSVASPAAIGGIWGGFSSRIAQDDAM